jgi:hypothetical protein
MHKKKDYLVIPEEHIDEDNLLISDEGLDNALAEPKDNEERTMTDKDGLLVSLSNSGKITLGVGYTLAMGVCGIGFNFWDQLLKIWPKTLEKQP